MPRPLRPPQNVLPSSYLRSSILISRGLVYRLSGTSWRGGAAGGAASARARATSCCSLIGWPRPPSARSRWLVCPNIKGIKCILQRKFVFVCLFFISKKRGRALTQDGRHAPPQSTKNGDGEMKRKLCFCYNEQLNVFFFCQFEKNTYRLIPPFLFFRWFMLTCSLHVLQSTVCDGIHVMWMHEGTLFCKNHGIVLESWQ